MIGNIQNRLLSLQKMQTDSSTLGLSNFSVLSIISRTSEHIANEDESNRLSTRALLSKRTLLLKVVCSESFR